MKNTIIILAILFPLVVGAQDAGPELQEQLLTIGAEAAPKYLTPFMQVIGTGLNNGWYKSSKNFSMFGLPIGFNAGSMAFTGGLITDDMRTFDFTGTINLKPIIEEPARERLEATYPGVPSAFIDSIMGTLPQEATFTKTNVPTIFGSQVPEELSVADLLEGDPAALSTINQIDPTIASQSVPLPFIGMIPGDFWASVPNINLLTVGIKKIPLINNIQAGVSYVPSVDRNLPGLGDVQFKYLSYKIQHNINHMLFLGNQKTFNISGYYAANSMDLKVGTVSMDVKSWNAMANVSLDLKILGIIGLGAFVGAGYESNGMDVVVDTHPGLPGLPGFAIKVDPKRSPKTGVGGRLSFLIFDVWGEYNIGQVQSYTFGITAIAFDGL